MNINDVNRGITKHRPRRRIGRGIGSGYGKTASKGHKGQSSRHGYSMPAVFQGGTSPLVRRVAKRGFNNKFALAVAVVNVEQLDAAFANGDEVHAEALVAKNLAKGQFDHIKILGNGELTKKLKVTVHRASKSAAEKIEKAGGSITLLPGKRPVVKNKQSIKRK
jgi:large subunit ribosomal protein L15